MEWMMIAVFIAGYVVIALEHPLRINKSGTALLLGTLLWVIYTYFAPTLVPVVSKEAFDLYLEANSYLKQLPLAEQVSRFVVGHQVTDSIGEICETLLFLVGAMITVELIDTHGGFAFITDRITTNKKRTLLWLITGITFFMSAVLDNLTTSIVMIMLIRKLVRDYKERWILGSIIIIAANSGGAWSPIGDVTTIMLWVGGNISTSATIPYLLLPCIVSCVLPAWLLQRKLSGTVVPPDKEDAGDCQDCELVRRLKKWNKLSILVLGLLCLLLVPVFKTVTHLPPFMGILMGVGFLWVYTEIMYQHLHGVNEKIKQPLAKVVHRIDGSTLLFFLGILMAVNVLQYAGILESFSRFLDKQVGNVYAVNLIIGFLSSIVDNVPLVAGAMGMYPIVEPATLSTMADPAYMANFVQDGIFWQFLAYCAGVGGSILIIGSAAGVVVMGLERIQFIWYLKHISWLALLGYLAGAAVYILERMLI